MYRVVVKTGRPDTIHQEHPHEECNVDDALDREWCDAEQARQRVAGGEAEYCRHCLPEGILE